MYFTRKPKLFFSRLRVSSWLHISECCACCFAIIPTFGNDFVNFLLHATTSHGRPPSRPRSFPPSSTNHRCCSSIARHFTFASFLQNHTRSKLLVFFIGLSLLSPGLTCLLFCSNAAPHPPTCVSKLQPRRPPLPPTSRRFITHHRALAGRCCSRRLNSILLPLSRCS